MELSALTWEPVTWEAVLLVSQRKGQAHFIFHFSYLPTECLLNIFIGLSALAMGRYEGKMWSSVGTLIELGNFGDSLAWPHLRDEVCV